MNNQINYMISSLLIINSFIVFLLMMMYQGNVKYLLLTFLMRLASIVRSIVIHQCMSLSKTLLTVGITIKFILIIHVGIMTSGDTLLTVLPLLMIILSHYVIKHTLTSLCFSLRGCSLNTL